MANIYDNRSFKPAGYNEGTKVETIIDHHEVNRDLSSGSILTVVSIAHFTTRVIAVDNNGLEWTLPLHSIMEHDNIQSTSDIDDDREKS